MEGNGEKTSEVLDVDSVNSDVNKMKICVVCLKSLTEKDLIQCNFCHGFFHAGKCAGVGDINCLSCEKSNTQAGKFQFFYVLIL